MQGTLGSAVLFTILISFQQCLGQSDSLKSVSLTKRLPLKEFVVPAFLIGVGILTNADDDLINQFEIYNERNEWLPNFRTHVDDYFQYAPITAVFSLAAFGVKGKNNVRIQIELLMRSELIMTAMVFPLKKILMMPRPDGGGHDSFPSGHTAQAFAAATFLHMEYGKDHPIYIVLSYGVATSIGALRIMNNRHWTSDVLMGAGIGILSTRIAYLTYDEKTKNEAPDKKTQIICLPAYLQGTFGVSAIMIFR